MRKHFSSAVCAAALLLVAGAGTNVAFTPAIAQDVQVDFDTFHDQLAPYGDWVYSDRWGEVWIPTDVADDFHPYGTQGHWVDTDEYGWTWASDYEWGDIPFHYGRWVNDPDDGWMWIPGYVWSPGWVAWRHNGQYTGWMPLPPDDAFLGRPQPGVSVGINIGGVSISFGTEDQNYGYSRWYGPSYSEDRYAQNWVFVGTGHMADPDYRRYEAPRNNYTTIIHNTTNITNYTVVNNYIVNKSVDPRVVQQAGGHVQTVKVATVIKKPQFITRADTGVQIQQRARMDRPRGTGFANSAPKPSATVVQSLSTKVPPTHGGRAPMHVYTRDTVVKAALPEKAGGPVTTPEHGDHMTGPAMTGPAMTGPKDEKHDHTMTGPAMTGPAGEAKPEKPTHDNAMTGPAMTGPKEDKHDHTMTGPAMTGPAGETKPEKPAHDMTGPAMTGPEGTTTEPKHEKHMHETGPAMTGPSMSGPAVEPKEPKREMHAPAVDHPVETPKIEHAPVEHVVKTPAAPKTESAPPAEDHKKKPKPQ